MLLPSIRPSLASFISMGLAVLAMAPGCGGAGEAPEDPEESTDRAEALSVSAPYTVSWWNYNGKSNFYNIDSEISIAVTSNASHGYYYSTYFDFAGGGMGYMGLQQGAKRPDGTIGKMAIFSIWDSPGAWGPSCAPFDGEGIGKSCHLAYDWVEGHTYRLRVWITGTNAWTAWVLDKNTGVETKIGTILAPATNGLLSSTANFTEHFFPSIASCYELPYTYARFHRPTANNGTVVSSPPNSWLDHGSCNNYGIGYSNADASVYHFIGARSCGVLPPGQSLGVAETVSSCDGRFSLVMQGDGNLVHYMKGVGALWSTSTWGTTGNRAVMQGDGNLVLYNVANQPLWHTKSWGHAGASLAVQNDGNLVVYQNGTPLWWSGTWGH